MQFNYEEFKKEFQSSYLSGLQYIEKTLYIEWKNKPYELVDYTKEEYLMSLFGAVMYLNYCNQVYECSRKTKTMFNYDYYAEIRDLLFKELGFDLEDLYNY